MFTNASSSTFPEVTFESIERSVEVFRRMNVEWREKVRESQKDMPVCQRCGLKVSIDGDGREFTLCTTVYDEVKRQVPAMVMPPHQSIGAMRFRPVPCFARTTEDN